MSEFEGYARPHNEVKTQKDHLNPIDEAMESEIDNDLLSPDEIKVMNILKDWMDSKDVPSREGFPERLIDKINQTPLDFNTPPIIFRGTRGENRDLSNMTEIEIENIVTQMEDESVVFHSQKEFPQRKANRHTKNSE